MGEGELELIQRALNSDVSAWGEIVKRYKDAVFGIAIGILGNPADAEDATHDAFIRAYEGLHTFHLEKRFSTWMFAVTANVCKNRIRRERLFAPLKHISKLTKGNDPAKQVVQQERTQIIRDSIDQLKPKYRMPLVLRYYADLDYKDIAEALGLPEGTVKTRLHRAKSELKHILEKKGVTGHA